MTWYVYRQNNSRGVFTKPAMFVAVEVNTPGLSADEAMAVAWARAGKVGVEPHAPPYCPCCGERWSDYADEHKERPNVAGDDDAVYSKSLERTYRDWAKRDKVPLALYLHADGTREEVMP
jgi:hypothetical protein